VIDVVARYTALPVCGCARGRGRMQRFSVPVVGRIPFDVVAAAGQGWETGFVGRETGLRAAKGQQSPGRKQGNPHYRSAPDCEAVADCFGQPGSGKEALAGRFTNIRPPVQKTKQVPATVPGKAPGVLSTRRFHVGQIGPGV